MKSMPIPLNVSSTTGETSMVATIMYGAMSTPLSSDIRPELTSRDRKAANIPHTNMPTKKRRGLPSSRFSKYQAAAK